jgi:hypothetical protein
MTMAAFVARRYMIRVQLYSCVNSLYLSAYLSIYLSIYIYLPTERFFLSGCTCFVVGS